jgi:hypothetical protein
VTSSIRKAREARTVLCATFSIEASATSAGSPLPAAAMNQPARTA